MNDRTVITKHVAFDTRRYDAADAFERAKARYQDEHRGAKTFNVRLVDVVCHHGQWKKGPYFSWTFEIT